MAMTIDSGGGAGVLGGPAHGQSTLFRWDTSTAVATIVLVALAVLIGLHISFRGHASASI